MSQIHKLDKVKIEEYLFSRGWKRGPHGEWETPIVYSYEKSEGEWTEAILQGIVCELEEKKKETEEFLKKYPPTRRP